MRVNKNIIAGLLGAAVGLGGVAAGSAVNAYVACNRFGECWHVRDRLAYPVPLGVVIHENDWRFDRPGYYHWRRDRDDRGYWYHNHWRRF